MSPRQCLAADGTVRGTGRFGRTCVSTGLGNPEAIGGGGEGEGVSVEGSNAQPSTSGTTPMAVPALVCTGKLDSNGDACWCGSTCYACTLVGIKSGGYIAGGCNVCKNGRYLLGGVCVTERTCTAATGVPQGNGNFNRACRISEPQLQPPDAARVRMLCTGTTASEVIDDAVATGAPSRNPTACRCSNIESGPGEGLQDCYACEYWSSSISTSTSTGGECITCKNSMALLLGKCQPAADCDAAGGILNGRGRFGITCVL